MTMTLLARVENDAITALITAPTARGWDNDQWWDFHDPDVLAEWMNTYGWTVVPDPGPQPADTHTTRHVMVVTWGQDGPVAAWVEVNKSAEELAAQAAIVQREADRQAVRAILDRINATIDAAKASKVETQAVLDAVAPTTVAQAWARTKDLARSLQAAENALIDAAQDVKTLARYVRDV